MDEETAAYVLLAATLLNTPQLVQPAAKATAQAIKRHALPEGQMELLQCDDIACTAIERAEPTIKIRRSATLFGRALSRLGYSSTAGKQQAAAAVADTKKPVKEKESEGSCVLL